MLQRDLARQRREGEPARRLDKTEVETAWQRAKLEMETDDFLDVLADNPTGSSCIITTPVYTEIYIILSFFFASFHARNFYK